MAVPKSKITRARKNARNARKILKVHNLNKCTSCSRSKKRHHVCLHCFEK